MGGKAECAEWVEGYFAFCNYGILFYMFRQFVWEVLSTLLPSGAADSIASRIPPGLGLASGVMAVWRLLGLVCVVGFACLAGLVCRIGFFGQYLV